MYTHVSMSIYPLASWAQTDEATLNAHFISSWDVVEMLYHTPFLQAALLHWKPL